MKTANFPRSTVENFPWTLRQESWLISVCNTQDQPAKVTPNVFGRILFLSFDDVESLLRCNRNERRISHDQILQIVEFIKEAKEAKVDLFVNCHAGQCRSGAIVEVLMLLGWQADEEICVERIPNKFVFHNIRRMFKELQQSWEDD